MRRVRVCAVAVTISLPLGSGERRCRPGKSAIPPRGPTVHLNARSTQVSIVASDLWSLCATEVNAVRGRLGHLLLSLRGALVIPSGTRLRCLFTAQGRSG